MRRCVCVCVYITPYVCDAVLYMDTNTTRPAVAAATTTQTRKKKRRGVVRRTAKQRGNAAGVASSAKLRPFSFRNTLVSKRKFVEKGGNLDADADTGTEVSASKVCSSIWGLMFEPPRHAEFAIPSQLPHLTHQPMPVLTNWLA